MGLGSLGIVMSDQIGSLCAPSAEASAGGEGGGRGGVERVRRGEGVRLGAADQLPVS